MSRKLNVGVIGVGGIAKTHFPGWKQSSHAQLAALADINKDNLDRAAASENIALRYLIAEELIANPDIDIVDICTPNATHAPLAIAALQHGKHVLCEKPLAVYPAEIRAMIDARDKSGKQLMTAQHFRFHGSARALWNELSSGLLGNIYHARCWMLRRAWAPLQQGFICQEYSGGGPCIDIGVHILDLALWLMGHPRPISVSGAASTALAHRPDAFSLWGGAIPKEFDVEDFAAGFVRFDNGATLILEVSWLMHHKTSTEDTQIWLYGDKAGAHWPSNEIITSNNATRQLINSQLQIADTTVEPHALECMEFASSIAEGRPSPVPAEQSLVVMTILDALYRSARTGHEVTLG